MRASIKQAIAVLPESLKQAVEDIVVRPDFDATISADTFSSLLTLSGLSDNELRVALLPIAAAYSVCPLSKFYVGAIARGLSGTLYFGANFEIPGVQLGQTIHAEQSSISHAWVKGEEGIIDITVNESPCGHCRQFMNELNTAKNLKIQLPGRSEKPLHFYLPEDFGPADLDVKDGLMTPVDHGLTHEVTEPLLISAIEAANRSHAPYTRNLSGIAIKTRSGKIYQGFYAENAAFNPSLPPLQVAIINMTMAGEKLDSIEEAALVESGDSLMNHLACTQSSLEAINPDIPLSYLSL
ncbi:cytidine deaminase [Veronia pacifica]|uniref:Cytidine deaminase n=1 Tax=Veronia pacifica TaxID=1080227 RepID=A0A1C3EE07_9GAMM|nr:cytidine deaminase [Veronia pacifica]ODA31476.1 cytidine deaminase [Veronia pacifica]